MRRVLRGNDPGLELRISERKHRWRRRRGASGRGKINENEINYKTV